MPSIKKQTLGQFMTTRWDYILQSMSIPQDVNVIVEPFVGKGDLLNIIDTSKDISLELYDIEPNYKNAIQQDTLMDPPSYAGKYVLTNPPYLARNKSTDKKAFDMYKTNDLYKCFIISLINDPPTGGIVIIPLNFLSSIRVGDITLRRRFCQKFNLTKINIFEERVFDDTTYTVCAIQFELGTNTDHTSVDIYPSKRHLDVSFNEDNDYMLGGELYKLPQSPKYKIGRYTRLNYDEPCTNILVKCIDDSHDKQICLTMVDDKNVYVDDTKNLSARTYATLVITPEITMNQQKELCSKFNNYLRDKRKLYNSLFLTNYRESKDIARKRISFGLVYSICGYLLDDMNDLTEQLQKATIE